MERNEWLEARRKGIGGSDVAAICGLSRWKSPMDVYLDKNGAASEVEQNEAMYWGSAIEGLLRERFAAEHPELEVAEFYGGVAANPEYSWMVATYDGICWEPDAFDERGELKDPDTEPVAGWEGKTASSFKRKEWDGADVPDEYYLQCQWYMGVSGWPRWYLSVLIGGNDYREFVIERDDEVITMLQNKAQEFWRLVEDRTPPAIDGSEASGRLLDRLYPAEDAVLEPVPVMPEAESLARAYLEARQALAGAQTIVDTIANELKALAGSHAVVATPSGYEIDWKPRTRVSYDTKRLAEEQPAIAEQYRKTTDYRVFSVREPKGADEE